MTYPSYPSSAAQQRLWFAARLDPASCAYTLGQVYRLDGPLDPAALDVALAALVLRHRTLRTTFAEVDGLARQVIEPAWQGALELIECGEQDVSAQVERVFAEPFELSTGPLFRARLLRLSPTRQVLALSMHHIVSDGWSFNILLRDLSVLYAAALDGVPAQLPPIAAEYTDLTANEAEFLQSAECAEQVGRWVDRLRDVPTVLPLPTRTRQRLGLSFEGRCRDFTLPDSLAVALRSCAAENYATLHMAAFAAFQALLSRISGLDDLVVGMPIAGRTDVAAQDVVGFFVNALPIRADLRGGPSFSELVERVRDASMDAYGEQNVPFERIVEALNPVRQLGVNPLVQVTFQLFEGSIGTDLRLRDVECASISNYRRSVAFDLTFDLYHVAGQLRGQLHYRDELFSAGEIDALIAAFGELLAAALADPDCPIPVLPMSGAGGEGVRARTELSAAGPSDHEADSLFDRLAELAATDPRRVALVAGEQQLSIAELHAACLSVAAGLRGQQVGAEQLVMLTGDDPVQLLTGVLGAWHASVPVLISAPDAPDEQPFAPDLVLVADGAGPTATGRQPEPGRLRIADLLGTALPASGVPAGPLPDAPAMLLGRELAGRPAVALVTHRALDRLAELAEPAGGRRVAVSARLQRQAPWTVLLQLLGGAQVQLLPEPADGLRGRGLRPGDLLALTAGELASAPGATGPDLLVHEIGPRGGELDPVAGRSHRWGPVECLGHAVHWQQDSFQARPLPGVELIVLDPAGRPVRSGVVGELCVSAGHLASGYPGRPAETAESFPPASADDGRRWLRTGERGRINAAGQVQILGVQEESLLASEQADVAYEPPRTATEHTVATLTAAVLGLDRIGRLDNFFAAGGHSLTAVQLISRLRGELATQLSVRAVFERPTVAALAELIDASGPAAADGTGGLVRRPDLRPAPASFGQRRLWFLQRMDPTGSEYNMYAPFRIAGPVRLPALRAALAGLAGRHETLRTRLVEVAGRLVQQVEPAWAGELSLSTLGPAEPGTVEEGIQRHLDAITAVPFDLTAGPVFGADLLRIAPDDHLLTLTMHHAISDGHSVAVMIRDLSALYNEELTGRPALLPELAVQYSDYACWQHETLQGEVLAEQLSYWSEHVEGAPQLLELPADRRPDRAPSTVGGIVGFSLAPAQVERLRELGRRHDATLFMVTLAVFEVLLSRVSGQPDLLVGVPVDGRGRTELEDLVGFFINTLPVRADLTGDPSFTELLGRTRASALAGYEHQELPFERIVEELNPERLPGRNPLVQVTFHLFAEGQPEGLDFAGTTSEFRDTFNGTARFDLSLDLHASADGMLGFLCYQEDQYSEQRARAIVDYYQRLLEQVVGDPELTVSEFELPSELGPGLLAPTGAAVDAEQVAPVAVAGGALEQVVSTVMAEVLMVDWLPEPDDDFFVNGGHSLTAVQLASRLQSVLATEVSVLTVFENPTVRTLATAIAEAQESTVPPLRAGSARRPAPVSYAQQRLWLIQQLDLESNAYNMYDPTRIQGPLEVAALDTAIQALAARHEALRTRFDVVDQELVQIVDESWAGALHQTDLSAIADAERERLPELLAEIAARPYDLAEDALFRADLIRLDELDHVLVLSMHHILSDGRSMAVLKSDLSALYDAARTGRPAELAELSVQYSDYAAWQRELLTGETLERELSYWTGQLAGAPQLLDLPTDFERSSSADVAGGAVYFHLEPELVGRLRRLATDNGGTLFMVVLSAFQALMAQCSSQSDVVVGVPVACRTQAEIENVVGFFINTLPIRAELSDDPDFEELLARTRDHFLGGLAHQELPFDRLVEALNPERLLGTVPIVQVACQLFEEEIVNGLALEGARTSYHGVFNQTARFDLQLDLFRVADAFDGALYYRRSLFRPESAERIVAAMLDVLRAIGDNPRIRVGQLAPTWASIAQSTGSIPDLSESYREVVA